MSEMSVALLEPARVHELWPILAPMLRKACEANPIAKGEMNEYDVLFALSTDKAVAFVGRIDGYIVSVLVLQFFDVHGHKGADVMAVAGRNLLSFKAAYWEPINDWLRVNGVEFLDAYVPLDRVEIYTKKFGFTESCAYVRMPLGEKS